VVAIDAKKRANSRGWDVYTYGGRQNTGLNAIQWAQRVEKLGAGEILLTSMDRDGTQTGYDLDLLAELCTSVQIPVIASGGAGTKEHFLDAFKKGHAHAALAASLFHRQELQIKDLKRYLHSKGVPVRGWK
jgi:cyclase